MRLRLLVAGAVVASLAVAVWRTTGVAPQATTPVPAVSTTTAPVTRGDATERVRVAGALGYEGSYEVVNHLPRGVLTTLPHPGTVVTRGGTLCRISGAPVMLLYGASPAYRAFDAGMSDGPDVRDLEANLVALGMDPARRITVDSHFTRATADAIDRWQSVRTLELGRVVFLPGAVRVGRAEAGLGALVRPGAPILAATSTTQVVIAQLTADRQYLVRTGHRVLVTLPAGGPTVAGTVTGIGGPNPAAEDGQPTVPVTIAVQLPAGSGDLGQAPVQVAITTGQHRNVLLVPVTALLAKAGGGYHVRVVEAGGTHRLVDVQPGLYDDSAGTVEVSGAGLDAGMSVEVPAS